MLAKNKLGSGHNAFMFDNIYSIYLTRDNLLKIGARDLRILNCCPRILIFVLDVKSYVDICFAINGYLNLRMIMMYFSF